MFFSAEKNQKTFSFFRWVLLRHTHQKKVVASFFKKEDLFSEGKT